MKTGENELTFLHPRLNCSLFVDFSPRVVYLLPFMDRAADRRLCANCHTSIGDEAVVALNRLWHPDHFVCTACKRPIKQTFQAADNHPYCVHCFAHKYNPKCAGCLETLIDTCLLALDRHWHPRCFTCSTCNRPLPNGEYYLVDDKPYDLDCHWAKRLEKREHMERGERRG